ncbi:mannan-binding lectin [Marinomonas transparens]|uniref:Mannan-binding lectin n=1 Tax=Marinomonas transparens TaxID=2795388 RepID=A0A934N352_9GAMM|nr:mannan-binding lectin [Marinomonas transparens]MBJ7538598.1 mannan-binding lectin [Marinomonas transparens]
MMIKRFLLSSLLFIPMLFLPALSYGETAATSYAANSVCPVDSTWLSSPSLPTEVKKSDGKDSNFCDFYQFSTQTFLYLMSPSASDSKVRNFQVQANFPVLEFNGDGTPADSCDDVIIGPTLRTGLDKSGLSTGQAGGGATIYAQDRNVVYYDVRFDRATCKQTASAVKMNAANQINFSAGTMELKFAWKKLSTAEINSNTFVTQAAPSISGVLGLVGMHIAVATEDHPEFVWATYEHKINSPDCAFPNVKTDTSWMFASASCAAGLPETAKKGNSCNFNNPKSKQTEPMGTPTNICRVHPYGTASGDHKAAENLADVMAQNAGMLALYDKPSTAASMQLLKNYFNVGALWVSDITKNSGGIGVPNERGSLRLANTVAETDYQHVNLNNDFASNCFGCHNYQGTSEQPSNNITSQALSHIFKDIKFGQGLAIDASTSSIITGNGAAPAICAATCNGLVSYNGKKPSWNGQWTNINLSAGSVCGCELK